MAKTIFSKGRGVVVPAGDKLRLNEKEAQLKILQVDPENGYDEKGEPKNSDHFMVRVAYPGGEAKTHQCKDVSDFMVKITDFIHRKFDITNFQLSGAVTVLEAGQSLTMEIK